MNDRQIGYLLKRITDKMRADADADFKKLNLTFTQSRVLGYLNSKGGQATQKELEDSLGVSHPTVVGVVARMEKNGYVQTWFDPEDKRMKYVALTEKADLFGRELEYITDQKEQQLLANLSEEQIDQLESMLQIIYKNIS